MSDICKYRLQGQCLYLTEKKGHAVYVSKTLCEKKCVAGLLTKNQQIEASILDEAKDLGKTVIESGKRILSGQNPVVSAEEQERRMSICMMCEKYNREKERCTLCGCFMKIKTWIAAGRCKLEKWNV